MSKSTLLPSEVIERRILFIRGQKVILDADLAELYGVQTRALNQAVRRNIGRFPEDFMFQLDEKEKQQVITICDHLPKLKFAPNPPYAFTEYGAVMVASILNSERAIQVSVYVVRVFIKLRRLLSENRVLAEKMHNMEQKLEKHDGAIRSLAIALRELTQPSLPNKRRRIGI
ncbi:ORF6N domain-containing protein [Bdellovibrionota bacterium FG-1]